jgi:hypothetical protein
MKSSDAHICSCGKTHSSYRNRSTNGQAVYSLGLIGALVYYISTATGFWMGFLGVLKAIVWPAFLVFEAMQRLQL